MTVPEGAILVAGNYCHDTLVNARGRFEELGGSASYVSAALAGLGSRFRLVAKVGRDFRYGEQVPVAPLVSVTHPTTHFIDDTTSGRRRSFLKARCEPIRPDEIGPARVPLALAVGVAMEITPELLLHLRGLATILICDAQALVRAMGNDGAVIHRAISETPFGAILGSIDYLKMSESEAAAFDLASVPKNVTILKTLGARGCELIRAGESRHFPAYPAKEIDPTGAGDCFVAGLAHALQNGATDEQAADFANQTGAIAIGSVGVPRDFKDLSPRR